MSCGVGHRHGSDLALLWLWHRLAAVAPMRPLDWEPGNLRMLQVWTSKDKKEKKKKKKKKKQLCHPEIPLLGIYPNKASIEKHTCIPVFIEALFTIARTWKQPKCPSKDEWIKRMWYIYLMEYYSPIKKNK